jgi:hypothetical protein
LGAPTPSARPSDNAIQTASSPRRAHSFAQDPDLWTLAVEASNSSDPQLQRAGWIAARECPALLGLQETLTVQIQSAGHARAPRDEALHTLLARCRGFATADANLSKATVDKLRRWSEKSSPARAREAEAPDNLLMQLAQRDPTLVDGAIVKLAHVLIAQTTSGQDAVANERKSDLLMMAALGAACDLGRDCSATAFQSLLQCAMVGACQGSMFNMRDPSLTDAEWTQVLAFRRNIVNGTVSGRFEPLAAALSKE